MKRGQKKFEVLKEVIASTVLNNPTLWKLTFEEISKDKDKIVAQIDSDNFNEKHSHQLDRLDDILRIPNNEE